MPEGAREIASIVCKEPGTNRYECFEWRHLFGHNACMSYECGDLSRGFHMQVTDIFIIIIVNRETNVLRAMTFTTNNTLTLYHLTLNYIFRPRKIDQDWSTTNKLVPLTVRH